MGKVELHKGSLIRIDTGDLTVEEYCEYICLKNNYALPYERLPSLILMQLH